MPPPIHTHSELASPERRRLLHLGLGGTLLLSTISLTANLSGCATRPAGTHSTPASASAEHHFAFLSADDIVLFQALLPAMIGSSLSNIPSERQRQIRETIERIDTGIHHFGTTNQGELRKLLNLGITRIALAGVWQPWHRATPDQAHAFLESWRTSRIGLLNNGYIALTKITNVAFYGHREHWHLTGYPGPPAWATEALPQFRSSHQEPKA
jgi:hypothetical protein